MINRAGIKTGISVLNIQIVSLFYLKLMSYGIMDFIYNLKHVTWQ